MLAFAGNGHSAPSLKDFVPQLDEAQYVSKRAGMGTVLVLGVSIFIHAAILQMNADMTAGVSQSTVTSVAMRFTAPPSAAGAEETEPEPEHVPIEPPVPSRSASNEPEMTVNPRQSMSAVNVDSGPVSDFQTAAVTEQARALDGDAASLPLPGPSPAPPVRTRPEEAASAPPQRSIDAEPPSEPASAESDAASFTKDVPVPQNSLETALKPVTQARSEDPAKSERGRVVPGSKVVDTSKPVVITDPDFKVPPKPPQYPKRSMRRREEGTVLVRALLSETGEIETVKVWQSSGFVRLDDAARFAVSRWRFRPAVRAGIPVSAWVQVPVNFRLN